MVLAATPQGPTRALVEKVTGLALESEPLSVALEVGAGWNVLCADTVPFCLWAFARHLDSFEEALWTTVSVPGDRDTNCAIVGGTRRLVIPSECEGPLNCCLLTQA